MLPAHDGLLPNPSLKANKITAKAEEGSGPKNLDVIRSRQVKKELLELLEKDPTIQTHREAFELKVTPEGVTISVFNKPDAPIFEPNTDGFTQQGEWLMGNLAYTFDKFSEHEFEIQGHTNVRLDANGKPIDSLGTIGRSRRQDACFLHRSKCSARTDHASQWLWRYPNARKPISAKPTEQSGRYPDSGQTLKAF